MLFGTLNMLLCLTATTSGCKFITIFFSRLEHYRIYFANISPLHRPIRLLLCWCNERHHDRPPQSFLAVMGKKACKEHWENRMSSMIWSLTHTKRDEASPLFQQSTSFSLASTGMHRNDDKNVRITAFGHRILQTQSVCKKSRFWQTLSFTSIRAHNSCERSASS